MKSLKSTLALSLVVHLGLILACALVLRAVKEWGADGKIVEEVSWIELGNSPVIPAVEKTSVAGSQSLKKVEKRVEQNIGSRPQGQPAAGSVAGMTSSGSVQNELLQQIRQRISRAKQYPMMAKEQGLEGVVTLLFSIDAAGHLSQAQVTKTSGSDLLDRAALDTLQRAVPYPAYEKPIQLSLKYDLSE